MAAAILAAVNFLLLSHRSGYRFDTVQSFNWDIGTMLTPYGIIKNLLIEPAAYLAPYYHIPVEIPPGYDFTVVAAHIVVQVAVTFYLFERLRGVRR